MEFDFVNGEVLLINKPFTWTSHDLVNKVKKVICRATQTPFKKMKVGHAGTLDPLATGLMIVLTGKKTKEQEAFMGLPKTYTGTFTIGTSTPSFDLEKEIDAEFETSHINDEKIHEAAKTFLGASEQIPPLFSAKRIDGERAYHLARRGEDAEVKKVNIEISQFKITDIRMPDVDFLISSSKGTYIRSIARDFGIALDSGAHLSKLCRTAIADYQLEDAMTVEELEEKLGVSRPVNKEL